VRAKSVLIILSLILITLLAGCGKKSENTITENPAAKKQITDVNGFNQTYQEWANRLSAAVDSFNQSYNSWSSGQSTKEEFIAKSDELYKETKRLKTAKNYNTEFILSEADKKKASYNEITSSYDKALNEMNDLLRILPTLEDDKINTAIKSSNKILDRELSKTKRLLQN
jgi:seryl-tRNA synthetase